MIETTFFSLNARRGDPSSSLPFSLTRRDEGSRGSSQSLPSSKGGRRWGEGAEEDVTWEGAEKLVFQTALASRAGRYSWALVIVPNLGMMYENLKSRERIPTKSLVMGNRMSSFSLSSTFVPTFLF